MSKAKPETSQELALLPPEGRAKLALKSTETEQQLRDLVKSSASITAVIDAAGREQAHRAGMALKTTRVAIEKAGKAAREDATAFSAAVIAEEKRLKAITSAEETRVIGLRDAYDKKLEDERQAKLEAARLAAQKIADAIADIQFIPVYANGKTSVEIRDLRDELQDRLLSVEEFGDRHMEAVGHKAQALEKLDGLIRDAEAAEKAEAERQRQAAAEEAAKAEEARRLEEQRKAQEAEAQRLADIAADIERQRADLEAKQQAAAAAAEPASPAPSPEPECATCNDNGLIGGPSYHAPDDGGVPCPDCTPPAEDGRILCRGPEIRALAHQIAFRDAVHDLQDAVGVPRKFMPLDTPAEGGWLGVDYAKAEAADDTPTAADIVNLVAEHYDVAPFVASRWLEQLFGGAR